MTRKLTWALASTLLACGAPPMLSVDAGSCPANAAPPRDGGLSPPDAGSAYRAAQPRYPRTRYGGGEVLTAMHLRLYVADADPLKGDLSAFGSQVLGSSWWSDAVGEYCDGSQACLGAGTFDGVFSLPAASGATYSEKDVAAVIAADVANAQAPEPGGQTLYFFVLPAGSTMTEPFGSAACSEFHAYHYFVDVMSRAGTLVRVPYAVSLRCSDSSSLVTQTELLSHELAEAAADPFMDGFVVGDWGWATMHGAELADVCLYSGVTSVGAYTVERVYSDRRAALGLDPCGRDADGIDFSTVPASSQTLVLLRPGESTTVALVGESASPTDEWRVTAISLDPGVTLTLDTTSSSNGAAARLTVQASASLSPTYVVPFALVSSRGSIKHAWLGAVQSLYE